MSSAHRPTFDHARGKEKKVASSISHKRALPSHSKLKFRGKKARRNEEFHDYSEKETVKSSYDIKEKVLEPDQLGEVRKILKTGEQSIQEKIGELDEREGDATGSDEMGEGAETEVIESVSGDAEHDKEESHGRSEDESKSGSGSGSGSDEDEDEEEALLKEIENIRKEREEAKRKGEEENIAMRAKSSNPLFAVEETNEGNTPGVKPKKKSWRSVKTMSKKPNISQTDRFSNDTLKSDFHEDFLDRYVQ